MFFSFCGSVFLFRSVFLFLAVAPMAVERRALAVAVLDGKLYAMGGQDDGYNALSSVERYEAATNAWEAVAPMAEARFYHAVAVLDGKLYAVGGFNNGFLSSVERYDPAETMCGRRWRRWRRREALLSQS